MKLQEMICQIDAYVGTIEKPDFTDLSRSYEQIEAVQIERVAAFLKEHYAGIIVCKGDMVQMTLDDTVIEDRQFSEYTEDYEEDQYSVIAGYLVERVFELRMQMPLQRIC